MDERTRVAMSSARILLVDDAVENLQFAGSLLKQSGYRLSIARDGRKALEVCAKTLPDLILLDVEMPVMTGYECCVALKENPRTKDIPVVFLTANTATDEIVRGFKRGAVDYIAKPFNAPELLSRIDTHLSLRLARMQIESIADKVSHYISPQVYGAIFRGEMDNATSTLRKPLTVFFSDVVGFTERTESIGDGEVTEWINNYCDQMATIVHQHGGTLDKFIGDAVMVFFGDPTSEGEAADAKACVRMAIDMVNAARELDMQIRVGINSGPAYVGNFGSRKQMNYTIIGGAVNAAARLEHTSQANRILVSQATRGLLGDEFDCTVNGPLKLKGIRDEIMSYWVNW